MLHINPKRHTTSNRYEDLTDLIVNKWIDQPIVDFIFDKVENNEPLIKFINAIEAANFEGIGLFDNEVNASGEYVHCDGRQLSRFVVHLVDNNELIVTCDMATLSIKINGDDSYILDFAMLSASNPSKYRLQEAYTVCKYLENMRIDYCEIYDDWSQID